MKKAAAIICSFLIFFLLSCGSSRHDNRINAAHLLTAKLQGLWGIAGDENAIFVIVDDRIIYPDIEAAYPYYWKNDSMKIRHNGYEDVYSVSMRGPDTLVLTGSKKQVYVRFKTVG